MKYRSRLIAIQSDETVPEERSGTRIRAFLSTTRPLKGTELGDNERFWEGRSLIENLALACDADYQNHHWDASDCATVLNFLGWIQPVDGKCFCNDDSRINATCGFHLILAFMQEQLEATQERATKQRRKARLAEVAHG